MGKKSNYLIGMPFFYATLLTSPFWTGRGRPKWQSNRRGFKSKWIQNTFSENKQEVDEVEVAVLLMQGLRMILAHLMQRYKR